MKLKRIVAISTVVAMLFGIVMANFADPTEDFHEGLLPGETEVGALNGPAVEEYFVYKEEQNIKPGSLTGDVELNTVGKGLFFDGNDFYFYIDTGVMATNYMFTIEGDRFFFGEDGKMVKEQLVSYNDELYYFDLNGAMYKNRWYSDEELDESENKLIYTDYYFGPTGRAYRAPSNGSGLVIKTIEGQKYGFNTEGEKLEGYYDQNGVQLDPMYDAAYEECVYYFDPDEGGAAATGWHYYEGSTRGDEYEDNEELVLYFDPKTCRKVAAKASYADQGRCISRIIDGQRYMFDSNGVRKNDWYSSEPGRGTSSNTRYFSEEFDGYLQKGWFQAVPGSFRAKGEDLVLEINKKRHTEDEDMWFYAGRNGSVLKKTIRKIGNYVYAFDDDGVMQSDAFVKVKNGMFLKAYNTDDLTIANILLDPKEYGGNADPNADDYSRYSSDTFDQNKGMLKADEGEQWMYFLGSFNSEAQEGSQARQNKEVKIELKDGDISFIQNGIGGYTKHDVGENGVGDVTNVLQRNNIFIQNGVILKPSSDENTYGVVRVNVTKTPYTGNFVNHNNRIIPHSGTEDTDKRFVYQVVNSKGSPISAHYKSLKDKNGTYIWVGYNGEFLGYYSVEGRYYTSTPNSLVDEDGNKVPASANPCWAHKKDGMKVWTYGFPPESDRIEAKSLYLNFREDSSIKDASAEAHGPYFDGIASWVYQDP